MSLHSGTHRATIPAEDSFRNGAGSRRTEAEKLAFLMEDAADYEKAREHLRRIVLRGEASGNAQALVVRLDGKLATCEQERVRLQTKLWSGG